MVSTWLKPGWFRLYLSGEALAFEIAHARENHETLEMEYETLHYLYSICNTSYNINSFFKIPKPLAFYDADREVLWQLHPPLFRCGVLGLPTADQLLSTPRFSTYWATRVLYTYGSHLCTACI